MLTNNDSDQKPLQTSTQISFSFSRVSELFRAEAETRGLPITSSEDVITLKALYGDIQVFREREGVRLTLSASNQTRLHLLREAVDEGLDETRSDLSRTWSLSEPGTYPHNLAFATVQSCKRLSPSFFRVTLSDPSLERFSCDGLHFRLLFPPADHVGKWPTIGDSGRTEWPGGMAAWHRPVYTTREVDAAAGRMVFDVFVHDGGRVTQWCRSVKPGQSVALMGPGGEWLPRAGWIALFGDETALPAIARILAALPDETKGSATVMVGGAEDIQQLERPAGVSLRWLIRGEEETLQTVLATTQVPETDRFVWFASERAEAAAARETLARLGLEKSEVRAGAFWVRPAGAL